MLFDLFFAILMVKYSKKLFTVKITNKICPGHSVFNLFNHKNLFRPMSKIASCKIDFIFWYSYMITNLEFKIFLIISYVKSKCVLDLISSVVYILIVLWSALLYLLTLLSIFSIHIFWYWSQTFVRLL